MALAVAGRFFLRLGVSDPGADRKSIWANSQLVLPKGFTAKTYRDVFTGKVLKPETQQGRSVLALDQVFSSYPVALLTNS
jgi:maltooligosyltrehalose synthase